MSSTAGAAGRQASSAASRSAAGCVEIVLDLKATLFQFGPLGFGSGEFASAGDQILGGAFTGEVGATGGDNLLAFAEAGFVCGDAWGEFSQLRLYGGQTGSAETGEFRCGMATAAPFAQVATFGNPVLARGSRAPAGASSTRCVRSSSLSIQPGTGRRKCTTSATQPGGGSTPARCVRGR